MFSFKSFAVAAALALGVATSAYAAPMEGVNVLARCGCSSVATIIDDVTIAVTPVVEEFRECSNLQDTPTFTDWYFADYITSSNCTVEALTPLVVDIKTIISGAIVEVNKLVGQPVEIILATVDGTAQITVHELAVLVANLIVVRVFFVLGLKNK